MPSVSLDEAASRELDVEQSWRQWFAKLEECRALKPGWNGYTAAAPAPVSIDNARLLLEAMQHAGVEPTRLAASAMGGIAVTRRIGDRKVLVEAYNDGRMFALFSAGDDNMRVAQVSPPPASLQTFLAEMREYLHG